MLGEAEASAGSSSSEIATSQRAIIPTACQPLSTRQAQIDP
jgi:hypothetical protein